MKKYTRTPERKIIYKYWEESPLRNCLNEQAFNGEYNTCMACGGKGGIDRAHIVSKMYGGSFQPSNIHGLCRQCHIISEHMEGHDYWLWIALKSKLFSYGTDMTVELDWTSSADKTLRPYHYEYDYPEKLLRYTSEYAELSLLENWGNRNEFAYLYLAGVIPNKYFDINYPCLSEIKEVMEVQEELHKYIQCVEVMAKEMKV